MRSCYRCRLRRLSSFLFGNGDSLVRFARLLFLPIPTNEHLLSSITIQAHHSTTDPTSSATFASVHHLTCSSCCSSRFSSSSSRVVVRRTLLTHLFLHLAHEQPWFTSAATYNQGGYRGVYKAAGDGIDFFNIQFVLSLSLHSPSLSTTNPSPHLPHFAFRFYSSSSVFSSSSLLPTSPTET